MNNINKDIDRNKELELANEKLVRNEKILIQAYKSLKQKENELKQLNNELRASQEELNTINNELHLTNNILQIQKEELESAILKIKVTQSQLIQSEKMASLGILTAGVAHEINNPLNFIMGGYIGLNNYFEERAEKPNEHVKALLGGIKTGIDRAVEIVKGLNQISRDNTSKLEDCDIHNIINNCLIMVNSELKDRIEIHKKYASNLDVIKGNVGKLHQVFINLLTNAFQAIGNKGTILISTRKYNKNIIVEISDSGCGISREIQSKIIVPFFTTKEPGKGTGLGLSITYAIIKEHNGKLDFKSKVNQGTTVKITLPIH